MVSPSGTFDKLMERDICPKLGWPRLQASQWRSPKYNLGSISDSNWISINGMTTKCFGKLPGVFVEKDVILLDPLKSEMVSSSGIAENIFGRWREYFKHLLNQVHNTSSDKHKYIWERKYHHCSWRLPSCCHKIWPKVLESSPLANSRMSGGLEEH